LEIKRPQNLTLSTPSKSEGKFDSHQSKKPSLVTVTKLSLIPACRDSAYSKDLHHGRAGHTGTT
jgi:hypothetical protein